LYCIKCGVELSDSEEKCPLCGTVVFHPYIKRPDGEKPYPVDRKPQETASRSGLLFILTMLFLLPLATSLLCDWKINGRILWSGYVGGALTVFYVIVVLPMWFRRPIPVVFVAADFIAAGLYLLYINFATGGHWFLSFAFPVTGGLMIIAVGAVALMYYLHRGYLYIIAGTLIATGGFMVLVEYLLNYTFGLHDSLIWSIYPLACCLILGLTLIIIACCPPLRESVKRKFFI
jgi:hypothetical protein